MFELKSCGLAPMTSTERGTSFGITEIGHCPLATPIGDPMSQITEEELFLMKIVSITDGLNLLGTTGTAHTCSVEFVKPSPK